MKLSQLMRDIVRPDFEQDIEGITCDSRRVRPGWAFVCIDGVRTDGHGFARQAAEAGASAIIAQRDTGCPHQIQVPSSRAAWARMCANWFGRPAERLHLIGITGTNGKTTVTYMLKGILESCGYKVGLVGTIQNMIGDRALPSGHTTPDPYDLQSMLALMLAEDCTHAVMEVSSHALDQDRVEGCQFDAAVFTNLTQDHLDYHGTMGRYLEAKKRLFRLCRTAVINDDDPWSGQLIEGLSCPVKTYSVGNDAADYTARNVCPRPDGSDFELVGTAEIGRVRLRIPGRFSVYNALAASACACALGVPLRQVTEALGTVPGVRGRAEIVPCGRDYTIVIDYAHTPDALENICRTLKECCSGRLMTLFGCGGDRDRDKRPKMGAVAARYSDFLVLTSDNPRTEVPADIIEDIREGVEGQGTPYIVVEKRPEAIRWAMEHAQTGDILLLAGKGHETYQVVGTEICHMDEREIVEEILGAGEQEAAGEE
ncbi:MAG: UDP-N-acetylmuramoyl-L-alanyl-D-glutamate--2,6-diaminopimelate ligase [Clostridiales bacterium]|nr:UDP-N-acetylmuramoyl-L-alanyl-D-glutamate--2,6-diaminopimelate ligase [Clostridiales bacterium]